VPESSVWVLANGPDSGVPCLRLCGWQLFGNRVCHDDGDSSARWPTEKLFDAERDFGAANGTAQWAAECGSEWASPACDAPAAADWLGVQFSESRAPQCLRLEQPGSQLASRLQLYACPPPPPAAERGGWRPEDHCARMEALQLGAPAGPSAASGVLRVRADTSCVTPVALAAAQAARERGADPTEDPVIDCFCQQQYDLHGVRFRLPPYNTEEEELCKARSQELNWSLAKLSGGVLAVLMLNQLLLLLYEYLIGWERLRTRTDFIRSQLWKLFLAQFVNTGLLVVLVNARVRSGSERPVILRILSVGEGLHDDISASWFISVGSGVALTIFMQVFSSTVPPLLNSFILTPLWAWYLGRRKVTQETIDAIYVLPDWNIALRMAQTLNVFFCIMMYSGGMPVLYALGVVYCFVAYWLDKWCLLHGSSKPAAYKHDVIRVCAEALPGAAFCHTLLSLWAFGNQQLFPSDWSHTLPLAEWLFGISREDYDVVIDLYTTGTESIRREHQAWYIHARCLDFSRKGCWLLFLILIGFCVYFVVYWAWVYLLQPVLSPWLFLMRECSSRALPPNSPQTAAARTFEQEEKDMDGRGMLTSYCISANPKYQAAYLAICHTATESDGSAAQEGESLVLQSI